MKAKAQQKKKQQYRRTNKEHRNKGEEPKRKSAEAFDTMVGELKLRSHPGGSKSAESLGGEDKHNARQINFAFISTSCERSTRLQDLFLRTTNLFLKGNKVLLNKMLVL